MFDEVNKTDKTTQESILQSRIEQLEKRLEVSAHHPYDGIACRDETIRQLENRIEELKTNQSVSNLDAQKLKETLDFLSGIKYRDDGLGLMAHLVLGQPQIELIKSLIREALESKPCETHNEEWFFRWIARGKGGHTPMDLAIDTIWHSPNNPYAENNPWQTESEE